MSIRIDQDQCVGCGKCADICPGSLIEMQKIQNRKKAVMAYPKNCWGCAACVKECKFSAISLYLGADIGGEGGSIQVRDEEEKMHWTVRRSDESTVTVTIDKKESNHY